MGLLDVLSALPDTDGTCHLLRSDRCATDRAESVTGWRPKMGAVHACRHTIAMNTSTDKPPTMLIWPG